MRVVSKILHFGGVIYHLNLLKGFCGVFMVEVNRDKLLVGGGLSGSKGETLR